MKTTDIAIIIAAGITHIAPALCLACLAVSQDEVTKALASGALLIFCLSLGYIHGKNGTLDKH